MKKRLFLCLLCAVFIMAMSPTVSAAGESSGFYNIEKAEEIEIIPVNASGGAVVGVLRDADDDGIIDEFYPGAESFVVTLSDTAPGEMYILTVSSPEKTLYADQLAGGGVLSFQVAFVLPDSLTDLTVEIGSSERGFEKKAVSLIYTPSVSTEPEEYQAPVQAEDPQPVYIPVEATEQKPLPEYASCEKDDGCPLRGFDDTDPTAWYHDGVHYALEQGIMNGVSKELFDPFSLTSRGMIVTMLWRLEGMPEAESASFNDVSSDAWYAKAVNWASSEHIVEGYDAESFGPDDHISREQLALILWRYAKYKGVDNLSSENTRLGIYLDAEQISSWAFDGMQWAVDSMLISGTDNEHLSPKADASRAQVATILMRYSRLK